MELTCQSVLEDWIANRKISSEKISFLELIHKKNLHNLQNSKVGINEICPAHICDELDIPRGNNMIYALAQFLDLYEFQRFGFLFNNHKNNLILDNKIQNDIDQKDINELNILIELISNGKISESKKKFLINNHETRLEKMDNLMSNGIYWEGEICPFGIIQGLNEIANKKNYIYRLDDSYPYWDYAIAFTLDLLNIDNQIKIFEKDYKKRFDEISNVMNYFGNKFKPHLFF